MDKYYRRIYGLGKGDPLYQRKDEFIGRVGRVENFGFTQGVKGALVSCLMTLGEEKIFFKEVLLAKEE